MNSFVVSCSIWGMFSPAKISEEFIGKDLKFQYFWEPSGLDNMEDVKNIVAGGGIISIADKYEYEAMSIIIDLISQNAHIFRRYQPIEMAIRFDFFYSYQTNREIHPIHIQQMSLLDAGLIFGTVYRKLTTMEHENISVDRNPKVEYKEIVIDGHIHDVHDFNSNHEDFAIKNKYGTEALDEALELLTEKRKTWTSEKNVYIRIGYFYNYESRWAISSEQIKKMADLKASLGFSFYYHHVN